MIWNLQCNGSRPVSSKTLAWELEQLATFCGNSSDRTTVTLKKQSAILLSTGKGMQITN